MSAADTSLLDRVTERLPPGETVLWHGTPVPTAFARRALHTPLVALYFAVIVAWRSVSAVAAGDSAAQIALTLAPVVGFAVAVIGLCHLYARVVRASTCYLLSERRLVMRIGAVVPVTLNLPLTQIEAARFQDHGDGTGNIALALAGDTRIAWLVLWPHARPWRFAKPEPVLRSIPSAAALAATLGLRLRDAHATARLRDDAPRHTPAASEDGRHAPLAA